MLIRVFRYCIHTGMLELYDSYEAPDIPADADIVGAYEHGFSLKVGVRPKTRNGGASCALLLKPEAAHPAKEPVPVSCEQGNLFTGVEWEVIPFTFEEIELCPKLPGSDHTER